MNEKLVTTWCRILASVPGSRLFLKAIELAADENRERVVQQFVHCGVGADRLVLEGPSLRSDYLAAYNRADISLDPFPYSGATTTIESLWMGVPVLTLQGDRLVARQGVGILGNLGMEDWISSDIEDYVGKAASHASDPERLASLRRDLRQRVRRSPICDAPRFAIHFQDTVRRIWDRWSVNQPPTAP